MAGEMTLDGEGKEPLRLPPATPSSSRRGWRRDAEATTDLNLLEVVLPGVVSTAIVDDWQ